MSNPLDEIVTHDNTGECIACRSRDLVAEIVVPAVAAWEMAAELPRFSLALHSAVGLLGTMLAGGVTREQIDAAVSLLLDEIESQVAEDGALWGPTQGTA
jgi:hypothetical protein